MEKMLRMCLNWKVLAALAAAALLIWVFAPGLVGAAVPLLLLALCPLSMLVMMRSMQGGHSGDADVTAAMGAGSGGERLAELRDRLAAVRREGDALAREIEGLKHPEPEEAARD